MRITAPIWFAIALCLLGGCALSKTKPIASPMVARFYLETRPGETAMTVRLPQSLVSLGISPKPVFSEYDIIGAEVARMELGLCVMIRLTPAATRDLYRLSVPAQGRRLVLSLNDVFLGVHRIERAMADGTVPVFLEVPDERLAEIVGQLKATSAEIALSTAKTAGK